MQPVQTGNFLVFVSDQLAPVFFWVDDINFCRAMNSVGCAPIPSASQSRLDIAQFLAFGLLCFRRCSRLVCSLRGGLASFRKSCYFPNHRRANLFLFSVRLQVSCIVKRLEQLWFWSRNVRPILNCDRVWQAICFLRQRFANMAETWRVPWRTNSARSSLFSVKWEQMSLRQSHWAANSVAVSGFCQAAHGCLVLFAGPQEVLHPVGPV